MLCGMPLCALRVRRFALATTTQHALHLFAGPPCSDGTAAFGRVTRDRVLRRQAPRVAVCHGTRRSHVVGMTSGGEGTGWREVAQSRGHDCRQVHMRGEGALVRADAFPARERFGDEHRALRLVGAVDLAQQRPEHVHEV